MEMLARAQREKEGVEVGERAGGQERRHLRGSSRDKQ
jgi:hypothetical protein